MNRVTQKGVQSGGDTVGRDKITNHHHNTSPLSLVEKLLESLKTQIDNDDHAKETIAELARYHSRKSVDGVDGLEAKLSASGQCAYYEDAIEKKEMFVKLLDKYALYISAQQIFGHFLAKAENQFNYVIYPDIPNQSIAEINQKVMTHIVAPIVEECGCGVFTMTYNHVLGMIYWLAEQCFIRWHGHHAPEDGAVS
ncbi:MAG: ABC-three component system protein [Pseudomonadota bacterium]